MKPTTKLLRASGRIRQSPFNTAATTTSTTISTTSRIQSPRTSQLQLPNRHLRPFSISSSSRLPTQPTNNVTSQSAQSTPPLPPTTPAQSNSQTPPSKPPVLITATVTRVGTMLKTVRTSRNVQTYDSYLHKHFVRPVHELVHDPDEILLEGDVIRYGRFDAETAAIRKEQRERSQVLRDKGRKRLVSAPGVRWVVKEVITPFGLPVEERVSRRVEREERKARDAAAAAVGGKKQGGGGGGDGSRRSMKGKGTAAAVGRGGRTARKDAEAAVAG